MLLCHHVLHKLPEIDASTLLITYRLFWRLEPHAARIRIRCTTSSSLQAAAVVLDEFDDVAAHDDLHIHSVHNVEYMGLVSNGSKATSRKRRTFFSANPAEKNCAVLSGGFH